MKLIRDENDYDAALQRIEALWEAEPGTAECDELELLTLVVEHYEAEHHPVPPPSPIEAIRFAMEQRDLKQKDLEPFIGSSGRVSEILSKKRPLTLEMIRRLHRGLQIPSDVLIAEYLQD